MKREFKVNERIVVYSGASRTFETIIELREGCLLTKTNPNDPTEIVFRRHPKQCRHLKPLREFWINFYPNSLGSRLYDTQERADAMASKNRIECIHVREVRKKK
jgi:hypothetical protein